MGQGNEAIPLDAISALERGNKIEAIKLVREAQGIGLKEAKDAVEDYIKQNPAVTAKFEAVQAANRGNPWLWLLLIIGLVIAFFAFAGK